jgi:hypothetical protein
MRGEGGGDTFFVCKQQRRIIMDVENEMLSLLSLFIYNFASFSMQSYFCVCTSDGSIKDEKMIVEGRDTLTRVRWEGKKKNYGALERRIN